MGFMESFVNENMIAAVVAMCVAIANVVTVFAPSVKNSEVYDTVMRVMNWVALNVGQNRNADDPEPKK